MTTDSKTASICGRYFADLNKNGIDDDEPGVEYGYVCLFNVKTGKIVSSMHTDDDGNYSFDGLPKGRYKILFSIENMDAMFTHANQGDDDTVDSDVISVDGNHFGHTEVIHLGKGEKVSDVDAGIKFDGPGSLSGRYFCDENCNGVDDGEYGVEGVKVELLDAHGNPLGITTTTAADGSYSFGYLKEGVYGVKFTDTVSGKVLTEKDVGHDDSIDSDATDLGGGMSIISHIVVKADKDTPDNDVGVKDPTGSLSGRYFCDENDNGVDDGEAGVEGVTVELLDANGDPTGRTTTTAADGSYTFDDLVAGTYGVKFTDTVSGKVLIQKDVGNDDSIDSDATDIGGGMSTISDIVVEAGKDTPDNDAGVKEPEGSLSGRYFCDENDNGVDDGEAGVEGVTVELLDANGDPTGRTTTTAADGSYTFDDLVAGTYGVKFTDTVSGKVLIQKDVGNDDSIDSDATDIGGGMSTISDIVVEAGKDTPDNDAGVVAALGSIGDRVWLDANENGLQDTGEEGFQGVEVQLKDKDGNIIETTITDAQGFYLFDELVAGEYSVGIVKPENYSVTLKDAFGNAIDAFDSDLNAATLMTDPITLGAGEHITTVDIGLTPDPGSLSGRYFSDDNRNDIDDSEPGIAGVRVDLLNADGNPVGRSTVTANDGSYSFGNLAAGTYGVKFTDTVSGKVLVQQNVGSDDSIDSDAADIGGGMSIISDIVVNVGEDTPDNDAGVAELTGSLSGRYFCDDNYNNQDDDEPGVEGVTVELLDENGNGTGRTTTTAADGSYSFDDLLEGSYGVKFTDTVSGKLLVSPNVGPDETDSDAIDQGNGMSTISDIQVVAGQDTPDNDAGVAFALGSIGDRVWLDANKNGLQDEGESNIEGVKVQLKDDNGNVIETTTTDDQGNYLFDELVAGEYSVGIVKPEYFSVTQKDAFGNVIDDFDSDLNASTLMTDPITLGVGEDITNVDIGLTSDLRLKVYKKPHLHGEDGWGQVENNMHFFTLYNADNSNGGGGVNTQTVTYKVKFRDLLLTGDFTKDKFSLKDVDISDIVEKVAAFGGTLEGDPIIWDNVDFDTQVWENQNVNGFEVKFSFDRDNVDGFKMATRNLAREGFVVPIDIEIDGVHTTVELDIWPNGTSSFRVPGVSPLVFDLNDNGEIDVTGETTAKLKDLHAKLGRTVEFDLDADGVLDTVEWIDGSGDGILVDTSKIGADGDIDGSALFGDEGGKYANGYEKLKAHDKNGDGLISGDELEGLSLWIDDGDAVLEEGELVSTAEAGIASISTTMDIVYDDEGRELMQSKATTTTGEEILTEDVWFAAENDTTDAAHTPTEEASENMWFGDAYEDISVIEADHSVIGAESLNVIPDHGDAA